MDYARVNVISILIVSYLGKDWSTSNVTMVTLNSIVEIMLKSIVIEI